MERFFSKCRPVLLLVMLHSFSGCSSLLMGQSLLPSSYFNVWDVDKNRKLTHAELYEGISSTDLFEAWDETRDGYLVRQEFYKSLEQLQPSFFASQTEGPAASASVAVHFLAGRANATAHEARDWNDALFRLGDLNKNGKLNKAEFYTLIFRYLDKDENGFLSVSESQMEALGRWYKP